MAGKTNIGTERKKTWSKAAINPIEERIRRSEGVHMPQPPHLVVENILADDPASIAVEAEVNEAAAAAPASSAADDEWYLPSDVKTVFLGGLFIIALLSVCYVAAEVMLPITLALVLKLVLQPVMRALERLKLPRALAAVTIILLFFGGLVGLGVALSGPAADWAQQLSSGGLSKLEARLSFLSAPLTELQKFIAHAPGLSGPTMTVAVQGSGFSDRLLSGSRYFVSGLGETVLILFFLLVSGDTFLRRLVEILPRFKDKRQAVDISQQIERDISAYLFTITITSAAVGVATGIVAVLCGLKDPLLWGTAAFLLNYIPILGPMMGVVLFLFAGLLSINTLWVAFLPAGLYLVIHIIEGETVTPMILARRFTINPVLVIITLVFWYWMWGVPGAILATPMLAIAKIICDRIHPLNALGHFIEG
jgi:predicted PurR-regulated permease PerM